MIDKIFSMEFEFKPVGQGLFYTGDFRHNPSASKFRMVYDCGVKPSNDYITAQIDEFSKPFRSEEKLDLLIISHFHEDHYSHIEYLLNVTNGVKTIILPFLSEDELLLAYSNNLINGGSPTTDGFFSNPTAFLRDNGAEEIIYIHPSEISDETQDLEGKEGVNISDDFEFILTNNLTDIDNLPDGANLADNIRHCYAIGNLNLNFIWEFKLFNKVRNLRQVVDFKTAVNNKLGVVASTINDITEYFEQNPILAKPEFRELYEQHFGEAYLNDTSLVVFHAPVKRINFDLIKSWILGRPSFPLRCNSERSSVKRCGNLLTGDIKMDNKCLNQITTKWLLPLRQDVVYFQIPHHGANGYFIDQAFNEFPRASQFVINFGLGNTNKHPRPEIINMITNRFPAFRIQLNTQVNYVKIRYDIGNYI